MLFRTLIFQPPEYFKTHPTTNRQRGIYIHVFFLFYIKCKEVQITASQYNIFCNFLASDKAPE
ncbi:hypothetical protein DW150_04045 [Phocaeicola vulgatus]|uniref:Uncharacterized protein n=1 Tax=Phocaeicola vulgatus TaxID=821 RepID=A0A415BVM2_PHOVU|nr:hypothetical protein DW150_04045 [Phocaeicola vulgatus]